jgi:hypothetical protein
MINNKRTGSRCRTTKLVLSQTRVINRATEGTIAFEVENLGRQLIAVRWNDAPLTYVFPDEIELADSETCPSLH